MIEIKKLMDEMNSVQGVMGSGVVSKDGRPVEMRLPQELSQETISIMAATVYGAACTLHSEAKKTLPGSISIKTNGCETHIYDVGKRTLAAVMTCEGFDTAQLRPYIDRLSAEFGKN